MQVQFVTQPFEGGFDLQDFIVAALSNDEFSRLDVAVAWAKRSGLRPITRHLEAFRNRDGYIRIVLGISEGGATRQGLELAMRLADEVYVYHHPDGRTFHTKMYGAYGDRSASVLVGSHNLTAGGLRNNFEAGVLCELDLTVPQDEEFLDSIVIHYLERLIGDTQVCHRLDASLLQMLTEDPAYRVGDEDADYRRTSPIPDPEVAINISSDSVTDDSQVATDGLFTRSRHPLRSLRRSQANERVPQRLPDAPAPSLSAQVLQGREEPFGLHATARWFKRLDSSNAQHPQPRPTTERVSNPTGHLTLTKSEFNIDWRSYFRYDFFAEADWYREDSGREFAEVGFDVEVLGDHLGMLTLTVAHTPSFESHQGNRSTTLHWGSTLGDRLRQEDLTGNWVRLDKRRDGTYGLAITANKPDHL